MEIKSKLLPGILAVFMATGYINAQQPNLSYPVVDTHQDILKIYPNPSSGVAHLRYLIHDIGYLKADLYMISGSKIRELIDKEVYPGEYGTEIDVSDLPAGVYIVRFQSYNSVSTKKLIVK